MPISEEHPCLDGHGLAANWSLYDLSDRLRLKGRQVPAHPMPDDLADVTVQRIVVRNGLSMDLADDLLDDIRQAVDFLDRLDGPLPSEARTGGFHH